MEYEDEQNQIDYSTLPINDETVTVENVANDVFLKRVGQDLVERGVLSADEVQQIIDESITGGENA